MFWAQAGIVNNEVAQKAKDAISTHTQCRLGRWYVGEAKEKFGTTTAYLKLNDHHKIVHVS